MTTATAYTSLPVLDLSRLEASAEERAAGFGLVYRLPPSAEVPAALPGRLSQRGGMAPR